MKYVLFTLICITLLRGESWRKHIITEKTGTYQSAVAGDFTGDGQTDVISSRRGAVILFTAPDWEEHLIYKFPSGKPLCIYTEAMDIDQDGDLDFIGAMPHSPSFWLENQGSKEEWTARILDPEVKNAHDVMKADVNNDGKMDLLLNQFKNEGDVGDSLVWLEIPEKVKEAPHWRRHVLADGDAPGGSHYMGFGDLDGDGWGEVALGSKGAPFEFGNWFAYWKNPGAEQVTSPWQKRDIARNQLGATNIEIGDLDGDGKGDFLASLGHGVGVVWFQAPDWKRHLIDAEMDSPHALILSDLDKDGDLDGAACGFKSKRVSVYYNEGKGTFSRVDLDQAQSSYDLKAYDMDGDGDLDLLNAGRDSKNIVWYENLKKL